VWFQSFVSGASFVINTGADGLQRLDYVVESAAAHGISLIINFVNNWTDYGDMAAYFTYYGISPVTDWYANAAAQAQIIHKKQKSISCAAAKHDTLSWNLTRRQWQQNLVTCMPTVTSENLQGAALPTIRVV
jgi:mannan endo-1,4-beta-mannosidase